VFPPRRISSQGRRPQNGSARTGKLSYFIVAYGNRSNQLTRRLAAVAESSGNPV